MSQPQFITGKRDKYTVDKRKRNKSFQKIIVEWPRLFCAQRSTLHACSNCSDFASKSFGCLVNGGVSWDFNNYWLTVVPLIRYRTLDVSKFWLNIIYDAVLVNQRYRPAAFLSFSSQKIGCLLNGEISWDFVPFLINACTPTKYDTLVRFTISDKMNFKTHSWKGMKFHFHRLSKPDLHSSLVVLFPFHQFNSFRKRNSDCQSI